MKPCENNPIGVILKCVRAACGGMKVNNAFVVVESYDEILEDSIVNGNQEKLERLLLKRKSFNIDQRNAEGETPLSLACLKGNSQAALLLLKNGASINKGATPPLVGACKSDNLDIIQLLLIRGADADASDAGGATPLWCACTKGNFEVALLLSHYGASIDLDGGTLLSMIHWTSRNQDILDFFISAKRPSFINSETPLSFACLKGNLQAARLLLKHGANINEGGTHSVVTSACKSGNVDLVRLLLRRGADVNASDSNEETPLSYVCLEGNLEVARFLLENGAIVSKGRTAPVIGACESGNRDLIRLVLGSCTNINDIEDRFGKPFIFSVKDADILQLFLDHGANVKIADRDGCNLLFYASSADAVRLLLDRGLKLESTDSYHRLPLHQITSPKAARALIDPGARIEARDKRGKTPLHVIGGVHSGNRHEVFQELISNGADVNARCIVSRTPLHYACSDDHKFPLRTVTLLLNHGARIDVRDFRDETPLHLACASCASTGVIELLLDRGADIRAVSRSLENPLHYACRGTCVRSDLVQLLLDRGGVDVVNDRDEFGHTPLHSLIITCLIHGISRADYEKMERIIKLLISRGANINAKNDYGQTPLSLNYCKVVKRSKWFKNEIKDVPDFQIGMIGLLRSLGADVNVTNDQGLTMLQAICKNNCGYCTVNSAKLAIECGANLDAQNMEGMTALHLACMDDGKVDITRVLLEQGAATGIQDISGNTPLHLACFERCWAAARLLLEFGANPMTENIHGECAVHTVFFYNDSPFDLLYLVVRECPDQLACIKG